MGSEMEEEERGKEGESKEGFGEERRNGEKGNENEADTVASEV